MLDSLIRRHMRRSLIEFPPAIPQHEEVQPLAGTTNDELGTLMADAYHAVPGYEGEPVEDAIAEVTRTLDGHHGALLLYACGVIRRDGRLVSASIVARVDGAPHLLYVITDTEAQREGLATALIEYAAARLAEVGEAIFDLAVTVGSPGEHLYRRLGFREVNRG